MRLLQHNCIHNAASCRVQSVTEHASLPEALLLHVLRQNEAWAMAQSVTCTLHTLHGMVLQFCAVLNLLNKTLFVGLQAPATLTRFWP